MTAPNYQEYSDAELIDVYHNIDRDSFPDRFNQICNIMHSRALLVGPADNLQLCDNAMGKSDIMSERVEPYTSAPPQPTYDASGQYIPNQIPLKKRIFNLLFSVAIVLYGGHGLYRGELWLPIIKSMAVVLSGISTYMMFAAILCASARMLTEVIDHYDQRDNEQRYYQLALTLKRLAYGLFSVAMVIGLFTGASVESYD